MSALFSPKKRTPLRMLLQDRRHQGHKTKRTRTQLNQSPFFNKEIGEPFDEESGRLQEKTLKLLVPNSKRLGGYIHMGVLFFKKGTHHTKISRSATRFQSRKHSDDACSCSTRLEGTSRGFQNSTMKCSGACQCGTHGIPCKEGRRTSLTRILPL